jgi:hypothetical protein
MSYDTMYRDINDYRGKLDRIERVIREFQRSGKGLSDDDSKTIKYPAQFLGNVYRLYYRTFDRNSLTHAILKEIIKREPDITYPQFISEGDKWYDGDTDRELWGYDFVYLGREEYKYTFKLEKPFEYPVCNEYRWHESKCKVCRGLEVVACEGITEHLVRCGACKFRKYLASTLVRSSLWIRGSVKNFSCDSPVDRGYQEGKGVVLYKFYSADLQYFSIINFTGEDYNNINPVKLGFVGNRIHPWASELMNFLVEAWTRRKYEDATNYIRWGLELTLR